MPSRNENSIVSSASSEALPITEDSFVIGLTPTANNAVQFSLSEIPPATTADPVETASKVPLMTRIYKGLIGDKSLFSSTVTTQETVVAEQKSAELEICLREVGRHDSLSDCWVVIYDRVYDITKFVYEVSAQVIESLNPWAALTTLFYSSLCSTPAVMMCSWRTQDATPLSLSAVPATVQTPCR